MNPAKQGCAAAIFLCLALPCLVPAQQPAASAIIHKVDAAVQARFDNVLGFTDIEHYAVYRGNGETRPIAEITVRDTYKKGVGKTYTILSESGSSIVRRFGLHPLLDNEKTINLPGNVEKSWFTSANYEMKLQSAALQPLNGRDCYVLAIKAKFKAPNTIDGTLWVDSRDGSIVQMQGTATKNPSAFAGTTHMMRNYMNIDGYSMATHARAESNSLLFGHTVVLIDYTDYNLQVQPAR
jgi:outer membrane lipoprotein-sorting protein